MHASENRDHNASWCSSQNVSHWQVTSSVVAGEALISSEHRIGAVNCDIESCDCLLVLRTACMLKFEYRRDLFVT
jgi:hypothetical protein